ncbi:hypothetical protein HHI36_018848 [Cryptolaemus montrouzieri]|uniref:fructose-bisphosphate aldolase n=1 Tax=Cryptolaemus montrouzieri TaxID=559131 RepID=A0ABD2P1C1_9CUCU
MGKRLADIGLENTEDNRRKYRQLLFTTDKELGNYISGVILFHETVYQTSEDGTPFVELLKQIGIVPGIEVDTYNSRSPSYEAILENANVLARYASICQANRIVPIVEREIPPDGDHDLERCQQVSETVLAFDYEALADHNVFLEGTLLKSNMVTSGQVAATKAIKEQFTKATVTDLLTDQLFLDYERASQASVLRAWVGKDGNVAAGQKELLIRAKANSQASLGKYEAGSPQGKAGETGLFIKDHAN